MEKIEIFNKKIQRKRKDRAYACFEKHNFLIKQLIQDLSDRFIDINKKYSNILIIGSWTKELNDLLTHNLEYDNLYVTDVSSEFLDDSEVMRFVSIEDQLPIKEEYFDLIISSACLNFVNDLPGCLIQIRKSLSKNGMFIGNFFGGSSLKELREIFLSLDINEYWPRIIPTIDVKNMGMLLQRAGFNMPVTDSMVLTIEYESLKDLFNDLRYSAQNNILNKNKAISKRELELFYQIYDEKYQNYNTSFDIISFIALN